VFKSGSSKTGHSIDVTKDGDALKMGPDNQVYVIDLKTTPPKLAATVTVGKQPSGLSFDPAGNLALITNRVASGRRPRACSGPCATRNASTFSAMQATLQYERNPL
jgi:YVTN family beta-propeller protein